MYFYIRAAIVMLRISMLAGMDVFEIKQLISLHGNSMTDAAVGNAGCRE